MLLTLTTTHNPATDVGFLLRKNPSRAQSFSLSFGKAHVFYPEATAERCTVALVVEVDPVGLVRNRRGPAGEGGALEQYVNDRPYAASSFLSVAIAEVFGSALAGKSKERPELVDTPLHLSASISVLACRSGEAFLQKLFEPLGYSISAHRLQLDEAFAEWGESSYFRVELKSRVSLQKLLSHLYVLVPVLDNDKHYWVGDDEVEKLLRHGEGWLASHPEREEITRRYLKHQRSLVDDALARLVGEDEPNPDDVAESHALEEETVEQKINLNDQRLGSVLAALKGTGAARVLDLGCGEGRLLQALLKEKQFTEIVGMDVSHRALEIARDRLRYDRLPPIQKERIRLLHGSLIYRDQRLANFDAAAVVEVIEHLDAARLATFQRVLFECAKPKSVVITTPNREYNVKWETLPAGKFRHRDHRFEWTRAEFQNWGNDVAARFGYTVRFIPIGPEDFGSWFADADGNIHHMKFTIPELSFVVLIGVSGSGKSTFARKHFKPTEILSSDYCRGLVSDDENSQAATKDAFEVLHFVARKRLAAGKLTVVDATNVQPESRKPLVEIAREFHCLPVAIVLDLPERLAHDRNKTRPDRDFGPHVIRQQSQQLHRALRGLEREGFRHVHILKSMEDVESAVIERQPLWNNLKHEHGPFDIIGDVHGCFDELTELLRGLGHVVDEVAPAVQPVNGRKLVFVGDLVDRRPKIPQVLKLVMNAVASGAALCVPGNHDVKLMRKLRGRDVQVTHGLAESLAQLANEPEDFRKSVAEFIDDLVSHYVLDDGKLVVAHAGLKESMQGRGSGAVREFALYGETTGETDEFGLPVRYNWAAEYRGPAAVVYGHTPVPEPEWLNRTINIDTGCVFGGKLTALRYPEKELVSVPAKLTYAEPRKPFLPSEDQAPSLSAQQQQDDMLDLADVTGKRIVNTRLHGNVTIREENATAALEVMSRFAANPKWLIYLPPTMSPSETSKASGLLEHPTEAFAYFRHAGVPRVICEEKHMGSRAVVMVCRDEDAARKSFGVTGEGFGICYTRTGRRFFDNAKLESEFLTTVRDAITAAGFWVEFKSDWFCLDCELMPWSAKAQELLKQQYAAVGASARASLADEVAALKQATARGLDVNGLLTNAAAREQMVCDYVAAYRRYCWKVDDINDLKLAPFHLLATEGRIHADKPHDWHMTMIKRLCDASYAVKTGYDDLFLATPFHVIDVTNPESEAEGIRWWEELTGRGGEGMVVKPLDFIATNRRGLIQPAVKCRGREYLRIIYGPEYTLADNLERLRARGLSTKRSLALREFALGIESLERFVRKEPLRRVHEAVFGVLALESEPVDPRL